MCLRIKHFLGEKCLILRGGGVTTPSYCKWLYVYVCGCVCVCVRVCGRGMCQCVFVQSESIAGDWLGGAHW